MATANIKITFPSDLRAHADAFLARIRKVGTSNASIVANAVNDTHITDERDGNGKLNGMCSFTLNGTTF